jgi:hypothetical protein
MAVDRPPAVTPGVKSIYLARRHPTLSRERFVPRWREHGRLAMGLSGWRHAGRYTHGDVLASPPAATAELGLDSERYFGVGMVWFPGGEQALRALVEDPEFPRLYADELEAFGGHVDDLTVLTEETVVRRSGPVGARLVAFLTRPDGSDRGEFWSACCEVLGADDDGPTLYVENRSLWTADDGSRPTVDRLPHHSAASSLAGCEGVVEVGFEDLAQLTEHCRRNRLARAALPGDQRGPILVVDEVVLDDGSSPGERLPEVNG